jgi:hypothetical protein
VTAPRTWHLEYFDNGAWKRVAATAPYTAALHAFTTVTFALVTTRCLRAVFEASTDGATYAAVAAQEWEVLATEKRSPARVPVRGAANADCRDAVVPS